MTHAELIEALERGETGREIDVAFAEHRGWKRNLGYWITPEGEAVLGAPEWSTHPHVGPAEMLRSMEETKP